jgi:hypothetical protein
LGLQFTSTEFHLLTELGHRLKLGHSPARVPCAADLAHRTHIRYPGACPPQTNFSTAPFTAPRCGTPPSVGTWTESIEELRQIADSRNDILAEAAGITAGSWYASPASHVGYELIGAGMLILAGGGRGLPLDYDELERWTRLGYERGTRSRNGER